MKILSKEPCEQIWRIYSYLIVLTLLLGLQAFFHPGNTPDYRIVVISLQLIVIVTGSLCFQPLYLEIPQRFKILVILWLAWGWICVATSAYPIVSCLRQMEWTVLTIFIIQLTIILQRYPSLGKRVFWIIIGGFFLVCGDIVIFLSILPNLSGFNLATDIPHFTNIRHFGAYAAIVCVLLAVGSIQLSASKLQKGHLPFLLSSIAWSILFWNGSRTGLLAASISTFYLTPYLKSIKERISYITLACATIFIGLCLSFCSPTNNASMGWDSVLARNAREGLDAISSGRITLWHFAIKCLTSPKELIVGIGPDVFRIKAFQAHIPFVQPHNMIIQSVLEWGVPGAIMFGGILLTILWHGWQCMSTRKSVFSSYQVAGYGGGISILIMGLFDGAMYHSLQLTMLGACTAMMLVSPNNNHFKR